MMIPAPCGHVEPHVLENRGVDGVWAVEKNNWTGKALMGPVASRDSNRLNAPLHGLVNGNAEVAVRTYRADLPDRCSWRPTSGAVPASARAVPSGTSVRVDGGSRLRR